MNLEIELLFRNEVTNKCMVGVLGLIVPASTSLLNGSFESSRAILTPSAHMKCMQNCLQNVAYIEW